MLHLFGFPELILVYVGYTVRIEHNSPFIRHDGLIFQMDIDDEKAKKRRIFQSKYEMEN